MRLLFAPTSRPQGIEKLIQETVDALSLGNTELDSFRMLTSKHTYYNEPRLFSEAFENCEVSLHYAQKQAEKVVRRTGIFGRYRNVGELAFYRKYYQHATVVVQSSRDVLARLQQDTLANDYMRLMREATGREEVQELLDTKLGEDIFLPDDNDSEDYIQWQVGPIIHVYTSTRKNVLAIIDNIALHGDRAWMRHMLNFSS